MSDPEPCRMKHTEDPEEQRDLMEEIEEREDLSEVEEEHHVQPGGKPLSPLVPIGHRLNATAYPSIVSDHVHPFMATMSPSSDGYFQQDNAPCHKAAIISNWFLEHDNELTVLKWPPQSPDLNPIEHLWDVVEQELHPTNLHQLQDAIRSIWANISKECFQHLVESMPRRIKAVLKVKEGQTQYKCEEELKPKHLSPARFTNEG
ncbi:hypothetical protein F2P79_025309 [Pimephales promelas]|nr:hypothetical protein F2P79_025309 [Pimephales promelas]